VELAYLSTIIFCLKRIALFFFFFSTSKFLFIISMTCTNKYHIFFKNWSNKWGWGSQNLEACIWTVASPSGFFYRTRPNLPRGKMGICVLTFHSHVGPLFLLLLHFFSIESSLCCLFLSISLPLGCTLSWINNITSPLQAIYINNYRRAENDWN